MQTLQPPPKAWKGLSLSLRHEYGSDADENATTEVCEVYGALERYGGSLPVPLLLWVLEEAGWFWPGAVILEVIELCPRTFALHRTAKARS